MQNNPGDGRKRPALFWRIHDFVLNTGAVALLGGILVFMALQIVTRYVFNSPLKWTEEITRNCAVWLTFVGGVIMVREHAAISIDAISNLLPGKMQKVLLCCTTFLCLVFFAILAYYGMAFVSMNRNIRSLVTGFNMSAVYSVIPVCAVLMAVNMIRKLKEAPEWKY